MIRIPFSPAWHVQQSRTRFPPPNGNGDVFPQGVYEDAIRRLLAAAGIPPEIYRDHTPAGMSTRSSRT